MYSANASSNFFTYGPSDEIQPVSIHSLRYFFSFPEKIGVFTGINFSHFKLILLFATCSNLTLSLSPTKGPCFTSIISAVSIISNP